MNNEGKGSQGQPEPKELKQLEVTKLYEEIAQLRNQQFTLGTIALTGSSLSLFVIPGIIDSNLNPLANTFLVVGATCAWLIILGFLFYWSLHLRKLILVISEYLKGSKLIGFEDQIHSNSPYKLVNFKTIGEGKNFIGLDKLSDWEGWFKKFNEAEKGEKHIHLTGRQTILIHWAFRIYGFVVCLYGLIVLGFNYFMPLSQHVPTSENASPSLEFAFPLRAFWILLFIGVVA